MRFPKYLSHSSISLFKRDRREFYKQYMCDYRTVRTGQNRAMSIGSAFDALVKSNLSKDLGINEFHSRQLFEKQVDEIHWDWAWENGNWIFNKYKELGAYINLLGLLEKSVIEPKMEFSITKVIEGVPLKGLPDLMFLLDLPVIIDFKVNGYCSQTGVKPKQTYVQIYPSRVRTKIPMIIEYKGIKINRSDYFELVNKIWAQQNIIYSWLMGESVGSEFVIGIEQLAFVPGEIWPELSIATHRGIPSKKYQEILMEEIQIIWQTVMSGVICDEQEKIDQEQKEHFEYSTSDDLNERGFSQL